MAKKKKQNEKLNAQDIAGNILNEAAIEKNDGVNRRDQRKRVFDMVCKSVEHENRQTARQMADKQVAAFGNDFTLQKSGYISNVNFVPGRQGNPGHYLNEFIIIGRVWRDEEDGNKAVA